VSSYEGLLSYVESLPVIDTHEHLPEEPERLAQTVDFFTLFSHYAQDDMVCAGLGAEDLKLLSSTAPVEDKWPVFNPVYKRIATGSYARAAHIAMGRFYGMDALGSLEDARQLSERMKAANTEGLYKKVLREACGIVTSLNFGDTAAPSEYFTSVPFVSKYTEITTPEGIFDVEKRSGLPATSLDRFVKALGAILEDEKARGARGFKFSLAYKRPLDFENVTRSDAARVFDRIMDEGRGRREAGIGYQELKPLQDYLVHRMVEIAGDLDTTVVFHTGMQASNWMSIDDTRPHRLWNLFNRHRNVRFNLLHAGFPWCEEAAVMGKHFPNLYLDMAWVHLMSPRIATRALKVFVDIVPRGKVLGFGGDYAVVENVYGHLVLARRNIARALSELVDEAVLSEQEARRWVRSLLHDAAIEAYRLDIPPLAD